MSVRRWSWIAAFLGLLSLVPGWGQELFWERPDVLEGRGVRFSSSSAGGGRLALAWEEVVPAPGTNGGALYLSIGASSDGSAWTWNRRFYGPIPYSGLERDRSLWSIP